MTNQNSSNSVATDLPLTADFSYVRFHGRNAVNWWKGNNETRYQYLYSAAEILELTERVKTAHIQAPLAFAYFNNHWKAHALFNANDMLKALQMPFKEIPSTAGIDFNLSKN